MQSENINLECCHDEPQELWQYESFQNIYILQTGRRKEQYKFAQKSFGLHREVVC